jgi:CheY-like chemotaxis protein
MVDRFVLPGSGGIYNYQEAGLRFSGSEAYNEMFADKPFADRDENKEKQNKNFKILIAEDDVVSGFFLKTVLKIFGNDIVMVKTGEEAVEICRQNPDIDLILMDIKMPNLNGYEATRQIRRFNKSVVIIAQTALALTGDREKAIEAGCNDYIAKPISNIKLIAMIKKYCEKVS